MLALWLRTALGQWQTVDRGSNESGLAGHRGSAPSLPPRAIADSSTCGHGKLNVRRALAPPANASEGADLRATSPARRCLASRLCSNRADDLLRRAWHHQTCANVAGFGILPMSGLGPLAEVAICLRHVRSTTESRHHADRSACPFRGQERTSAAFIQSLRRRAAGMLPGSSDRLPLRS
jgi:hypothetical protein